MLKPFYQGKLDTFCAIYAVLNALRLMFGIRAVRARAIMNTVLLSYGTRPAAFSDLLTMNTDYMRLVDDMLESVKIQYPMIIFQPYKADSPPPSVDGFWNQCAEWLEGQKESNRGRAIVFRFLRHLKADAAPTNRHWTTVDYVEGDILHLFDCSHEAEAILNIRKNSIVTSPKALDKEHLLYIQPHSARFLRQAF